MAELSKRVMLECIRDYIYDETDKMRVAVNEFKEVEKEYNELDFNYRINPNDSMEIRAEKQKNRGAIKSKYIKLKETTLDQINKIRYNILSIAVDIETEQVTNFYDLSINDNYVIFKRTPTSGGNEENKNRMYTYYSLTVGNPIIWINGPEELLQRISDLCQLPLPDNEDCMFLIDKFRSNDK